MALALTEWTERWVPDAFVFALLATLIVVVAGVSLTPSSLPQVIDAWGSGFWELIPFTLQMALIIITGHVLATSQPVGRVIRAIAAWPTTPRGAVALVAFFAMASSWFNWGFSLIFSAVLAREVARRVEGVDYRALAAASFLGIGSVWAQGLSGSAALQMATPGALQPQIRDIVAHGGMVPGGIIPFSHTIFLWQSLVSVVVEIVVVTAVMWLATPPAGRGKTARDLGIALGKAEIEPPPVVANPTPGQWLEHSPILSWLIVAIGGTYLVRYFMQAPEPLNAINLNIVNLTFLLLGFLLHKTPARLMHAVQAATPAVWGVILQFPFYAGIAGIITATHLNEQIAHAFVGLSSRDDVSGDRRHVLRGARCVRAVRRFEMGHRSAVRHGRRARAQGAPGLGRGRLRSRRGARQSRAAVLDAADPGTVSAPRARRHGLHLRRLSRARPGRAAARHDPRRDALLSAVDESRCQSRERARALAARVDGA